MNLNLTKKFCFVFFESSGLVWQEIKIIVNYGMKDYLRSWNNVINFITNSIYVASFTLKVICFFKVNARLERVNDSSFWEMAVHMNKSNIESQQEIIDTIYWLNNGIEFLFLNLILVKWNSFFLNI